MKIIELTTAIKYPDNEETLAFRIRRGDKEAFREFYNLYSKKIYSFALNYLKSKSDAEELIQAVFVKIWETRSDIQDNLSLKSYLYTITVNHIYNFIKHKKVSVRAIDEQLYLNHDWDNSTIENIQYQNLEENINNLIELLPEQRKIIFTLSRKKGLSHDEIAQQLKISVRTVESQIYKALKFLKKNLKEDMILVLLIYFCSQLY